MHGNPLRRLAIVGGGMGGLGTAWLCDDHFRIDLFEARDKLGGHADSEPIDLGGQLRIVDLGAQFFHPATHPLYVCLLEELGLFGAGERAAFASRPASIGLSFFTLPGGRVDFATARPLRHLGRALEFVRYARAARALVDSTMPFELTVDEWTERLPCGADFRARVLLPMLASFIGSTVEDARRVSVRAILATFAPTFPQSPLRPPMTWNSRIGLGGNLAAMVSQCRNLKARVCAPIARLERRPEGFFVEGPAGRRGPYEAVVLAVPPDEGARLVAALPGGAEPAALLARFRSFEARIVIHRDPVYMPRSRSHWASYNAGVTAGQCEGSVWLGALSDPVGGRPVDVFKSWATYRAREPAEPLLSRRFRHPLMTPEAIGAARGLRALSGRHGVWFAGQYTTGIDLQETALQSAVEVAAALAPASPRLAALRRRLAARGLADGRHAA